MLVDRNKLGSDGLEVLGTPWSTVIAQHLFQKQAHVTLESPELIDLNLLWLIDKIPYHTWWWALNMSRSKILTAIPDTNYSTLVAICEEFLRLPEDYWNDKRDRNFSGIIEAIELRLGALGYIVTDTEVRHYLNDSNEKRLHIPTSYKKHND
jgi:hypothetical protein